MPLPRVMSPPWHMKPGITLWERAAEPEQFIGSHVDAPLARAQTPEVLRGLRDDVGAQRHLDPSRHEAADGHIKIDDGVRGTGVGGHYFCWARRWRRAAAMRRATAKILGSRRWRRRGGNVLPLLPKWQSVFCGP